MMLKLSIALRVFIPRPNKKNTTTKSMEIFLIFTALVMVPLMLALPFYIYTRAQDKKEEAGQEIVDKLRGLKGPRVDWNTGL